MEKKENYALAVKTIKTAILQGQYAAAKGTNRIQLATYFAIGKYISQNSRHGFWGKGADKEYVEYIIQDYNKPMGVATYTTENDMPEKLRNALPPVEELKKLL